MTLALGTSPIREPRRAAPFGGCIRRRCRAVGWLRRPDRAEGVARVDGRALPGAARDVRGAGGTRIALVPRGGTPLSEVELDGDVVFVLGAERDGLPPEVLARCDVQSSIPQTRDAESLNVAMAGTVALYELARRSSDFPRQ